MQAPGRTTTATVSDVIGEGATWGTVNSRAMQLRSRLAATPAALQFVVRYVDPAFTPLTRPPEARLRALFTYVPGADAPFVMYLPPHNVIETLRAAACAAGGAVEFTPQTSLMSTSSLALGDLASMRMPCIFAAVAVSAAAVDADSVGDAETDPMRRAARGVSAAARRATSTSTRTGGPRQLGCKGEVKIVVPPSTSGAHAIVTVTPCTVNHTSSEPQAQAHLALHRLVLDAARGVSRAIAAGLYPSDGATGKLAEYADRVHAVERRNCDLILSGKVPNIEYPSFGPAAHGISYDVVSRLPQPSKFGRVDDGLPPEPKAAIAAPLATLCSCRQLARDLRDEPVIVCNDPRCAVVMFHRACVGVEDNVLGRKDGDETDDGGDGDGNGDVISVRWRCTTCQNADPILCLCEGKAGSLDTDAIECTSQVSDLCAVWYHYVCVDLTSDTLPQGDWSCSVCAAEAADGAT